MCVFEEALQESNIGPSEGKKKPGLKCIFHALSYSIDFVFLIFSYKEKVF